MDLLNLPRHIVIDIFECLDQKSRLAAMLVCKDWHDFIGQTPGLGPALYLNKPPRSTDLFNRKFSAMNFESLYMTSTEIDDLSKLISVNYNFLQELNFKGLSPSVEIVYILQSVPNIKKIVLGSAPTGSNDADFEISSIMHNFPKLQTLIIDSSKDSIRGTWLDKLILLFENAAPNLKHLELYNLRKRDLCVYNQQYSIDTWKLLHNKPKLKVFKIHSSYYEDFLVDLDKIQFQLSEFFYYSKGCGPKFQDSIKNMKNFVKTQNKIADFGISLANKGELEEVIQWNLDVVLTHVLNLPTLRSFGIGLDDVTSYPVFRNATEFPNIQKFEAHDINAYKYLKYFPNLMKIEDGIEGGLLCAHSYLKDTAKLQQLILNVSILTIDLPKIGSFPNLKVFHCKSLPKFNSSEFLQFLGRNPSIETLKLEKITENQVLFLETLEKSPVKIKTLEIENFLNQLNFKVFEIIGTRLTMLEKLKIGLFVDAKNVTPRSDDTIWNENYKFFEKVKAYLRSKSHLNYIDIHFRGAIPVFQYPRLFATTRSSNLITNF